MRRAGALALALLACSVPGGPRLGSTAPELSLPAAGARRGAPPVRLRDFRGRLVVLNFWASWCAPCVQEMPSLDRLQRALGAEGLAVVSVSADEDEKALDTFLARVPLGFPVLLDPAGEQARALFGVSGFPETFLIDPEGALLARYTGPAEWDTPAALDHFRRELARVRASSRRSTSPTR